MSGTDSLIIGIGLGIPFGVKVTVGGEDFYTSETMAKYVNESGDFYID